MDSIHPILSIDDGAAREQIKRFAKEDNCHQERGYKQQRQQQQQRQTTEYHFGRLQSQKKNISPGYSFSVSREVKQSYG